MDPLEGLTALVAILSIFVFLPWLVLHHLFKRREASAPAADPLMTSRLQAVADRLEKRVQALETILDAEVPGWRRQFDHRRDA